MGCLGPGTQELVVVSLPPVKVVPLPWITHLYWPPVLTIEVLYYIENINKFMAQILFHATFLDIEFYQKHNIRVYANSTVRYIINISWQLPPAATPVTGATKTLQLYDLDWTESRIRFLTPSSVSADVSVGQCLSVKE